MEEIPRAYSLTRDPSTEPEYHCRICLESNQDLILPCNCKTSRVHRPCLDRWRAEIAANFSRCEVCHTDYEFERIPPPPLYASRYLVYVGRMCLELVKMFSI